MKKTCVLIISMAFTSIVIAQTKHEISFYAGGGLSTLNYKNEFGSRQNGAGGNIGIGYTYFFNESWGVTSGAELGLYNAKAKVENLSDAYETIDIVSDLFEFRTKVSEYQEKQQLMQFNIPVMLRFRAKENQKFYAALGGKLGIPVNKKYNTENVTITNSGYYEYEKVEYTTQKFAGFGTFTDKNSKGSFGSKIGIIASLEVGFKWPVTDKNAIYTGVYADYGLSNITGSDKTRRFVRYDGRSEDRFSTSSMLDGTYSQNNAIKPITDRVIPLTIGLKVQFAWGIAGK